MDVLQVVVNILVPFALSWIAWVANRTISVEREVQSCISQNVAALKEIDRLNVEMIAHRGVNGDLSAGLARLSAQTEMVLLLLEQLKREIRNEKG